MNLILLFYRKEYNYIGGTFFNTPILYTCSGRVPMKNEDFQISLANQKKERLVFHFDFFFPRERGLFTLILSNLMCEVIQKTEMPR